MGKHTKAVDATSKRSKKRDGPEKGTEEYKAAKAARREKRRLRRAGKEAKKQEDAKERKKERKKHSEKTEKVQQHENALPAVKQDSLDSQHEKMKKNEKKQKRSSEADVSHGSSARSSSLEHSKQTRWNDWTKAELGNAEANQKFLKLMGAGKSSKPAKEKEKKNVVVNAGMPANATLGSANITAAGQERMKEALLQQWDQASYYGKGGRKGLGCS